MWFLTSFTLAERVCSHHGQQLYQTFFNVRNQMFINKLLDHQLFDTKTFNFNLSSGARKKINKQEVLNKNVGRNFS